MDEFEIEWIPEGEEEEEHITEVFDTKPPSFPIDYPASIIDKRCKAKYGHTNWVRMGRMSPIELAGNPHILNYEEGVIYFKKSHRV